MMVRFLRFVFRLFFRVSVKGDLSSFSKERLLITPNHLSFLDGVLLGLFLPIKPVFAIYSNVTDRWFIRIIRPYIDFAPMDPSNPMAIKSLIRQIEKGRPIVIFPEGRITVTGSLMKIYDGAAFIAAKSDANRYSGLA
ncbi:Bifunctional protein aas [Budvicia aquatica]|uniref:Bifunctional protein aas n=1 Tax=Budvicia aquatica TaxID=82979 RepID=A0A485A0M3_9GAMM|nr:Bifunctional protein aas [Budvicia aquatica]